MEPIEDLLKKAPLKTASSKHQQQMDTLLAQARQQRSFPFGIRIPLWLTAFACVIFALLGFFIRDITTSSRPKESLRVVYQLTNECREDRNAFDTFLPSDTFLTHPSSIQIRVNDVIQDQEKL